MSRAIASTSPPEPLEPLLSAEEVARILGMTMKAFYGLRHRGDGPPGFMLGKALKFRPTDVRAWIDRQVTGDVITPLHLHRRSAQ